MRAKSDGVCKDCKTRVVLNKWRKTLCFNCQSENVTERICAICLNSIKVGDDVSWDRRGGTWEAHNHCWLNSSAEARERVIRRTADEQERLLREKQALADKPITKDEEQEEDIVIFEEEEKPNFKPILKPVTIQKALTFYDWVWLLISARIHFYIYGPAGCGKSHIVEQAAHYFGMSFSSISLNVQTMPSSLIGYKDINGVYQGTDFRRIYEHGGVFLIDEMDNASGNLLTTLNSALANRFLQFPDGMVTMHADCVVVATGNTTGRGKTAQYISRQTLDAATLDRFAYLSHDYDDKLEMMLADGKYELAKTYTSSKIEFVQCTDDLKRNSFGRKVQKIRANGKKHGLQVVVSYRPTITGCKLLNHADDSTLLEMLVMKGVDSDTKTKLMEGVY